MSSPGTVWYASPCVHRFLQSLAHTLEDIQSIMPVLSGSIDLHTHTCYSDGTETPTQLVIAAAQQGVRVLAITDHDTLAALPEAWHAGKTHGVEVLPGIELSVQYQAYDDMHILGYLFDPAHQALQARLRVVQQQRLQRGLAILERINARLEQYGLAPLESAQVLQRVRGVLTRPHLATALIAQGYASTVEQAFRDFLIPCHVPIAVLDAAEAFALIAQAGGICSLAHPGTLSSDPQELQRLLADLKALGLTGVEVYHRCHYPDLLPFLQRCARQLGLILTGGSDYHGPHPGAALGTIAPSYPVPEVVLLALRRAHAAHQADSA